MKLHHRFFLLTVDLLLILASLLLALFIRFEGETPAKYLQPNLVPYVTLCLFSAGILWLFGLYNKVWRYASVEEGIHLFNAVTVSFGIYAIPVFVTHGSFYPRGVVVIAWLLALFLLGGVRLVLRLASLGVRGRGAKKVIVVGGGDAGEAVIRELKREPSLYRPVGILDEDEKKRNLKIHGVPVIGKRADLPRIVEELGIHHVVITLPSPSILKEVFASCQGLNVEFKTIPSVSELMSGQMKVDAVREIRIEDLLGREPIQINLESLRSYLSRKSILVTGAGGSIGSELCRQIASFEPSMLTLVGHGENSIHEAFVELKQRKNCTLKSMIADIRDEAKMERIMRAVKPEVVFHAAAHKHVPLMEEAPFEALENNFCASASLALLSQKAGVQKFVFLSTDKAVQPQSVMGASKRLTEMFLQSLSEEGGKNNSPTQFMSVRFGNVIDSRGSVVPTFRKQILMGGPVTVTHVEMTRYFMTIPEAVSLVLQAAAIGHGGEIFILDMGRPVNILELAHQMIRLAGYEPDKDIPVQITGSRPGERLREKLLADGERMESTNFEKIVRVRSSTRPLKEFMDALSEIRELSKADDADRLTQLLTRFIPEYIPRQALTANH